tara:strand:- start:2107 stop:2865 length:759 start_codon:yes stop_codon:yes gene_type:complete
MNYKAIFILLFITSCVPKDLSENYKKKITFTESFSNQGFALIFNEELNKQKVVSKKMDNRSLIIFQRNLKKNTIVKITNLDNNKSVIAKVGPKAYYPYFYNSVITKRISMVIDLDANEPYIKIKQINNTSSFIAKKAKTFEAERKVADKAPVEDISIKSLDNVSENNIESSFAKNKEFKYIIKIGDFYFKTSANNLKRRIIDELKLKDVKISKLTSKNFRVYLGPYNDLESLKNGFNDISKLEFENIEILKL